MNKSLSHTIALPCQASGLLNLFKDEPGLFFLDSSLNKAPNSRFSYLGFAPFERIKVHDFKELKEAIKPYMDSSSQQSILSAALGAIAYEGQMCFGLYDGILCIDHHKQTLSVSADHLKGLNCISRRRQAKEKINHILNQVKGLRKSSSRLEPAAEVFTRKKRQQDSFRIKSNTTQRQYIQAVKRALQHIYEGDIYQINLSHRFEARLKDWQKYMHPVELYQHLRVLSPSSFSAYLDMGDQKILSSSPERFLKLSQGVAEVSPMKGTRPRGKTLAEDLRYKKELLNSAKEKAELLMVTDLERNDLGRVCRYGSVQVKDMRSIETYATVFQATATVCGHLRKESDAFDLLQSTFPSGSVTGCPKIEAMKIIARLEKSKRDFYTGALGYIGFNGQMDFSVLIRSLFLHKDRIRFYVGGGIVADSDPKKEYEETLIKAQAMVAALKEVL